jgi:hypothetical protein
MDDFDSAIDELYSRIDKKLSSGDFSGVDSELNMVDIENTDTIMLLGWLSITLAAKEHLMRRDKFVADVRNKLERTDLNRVNALLQGLE